MKAPSARALWPLLAATVALAVPAGSSADPPRVCGRIQEAGQAYVVHAHQVKCDFALAWSRRYLRSHSRPYGFVCARFTGSRTDIPFFCKYRTVTYRTYWVSIPPGTP
jgi:hypothetical protein